MAKQRKQKPTGPGRVKPGQQIGGRSYPNGGKRTQAVVRMRAFTLEYLRSGASVAEASAAVGVTPGTGGKYLKNPYVKAIIKEEMAKRSGAARLTVERVMHEIACMAFAVMQDFAGWSKNHVALVPSSELTRDQGRCIQSVEETKDGRVKIKLYDKTKVMALAAQVLKMIGVDAQAGSISANEYAALARKALANPLSEGPGPTAESDRAVLQPATGVSK